MDTTEFTRGERKRREREEAENVERARNDRSRSKHFHGEKDAEVDKDETCQKEGGNNESAVTSSRQLAGFLASQCRCVAQTMHHRNCQMHLQVPPVPERKTASKYEGQNVVEHNVFYRSRGIARIRVDHV